MRTLEARYLDGSSGKVDEAESVGDIMFHFAKVHGRFASDVVVTNVDTGENLCDSPSQVSPPLVQVVVKPEKKQTIEDLLLTLRLHSKREDEATSAVAFTLLKKEYENTEVDNGGISLYRRLLEDVLEEGARGDAKIEGNILRTLIGVGVNANYFLQEASGKGNEGRVRLLLAEGVPIECPDDSGDTHACDIPALSAAAWGGREDIAGILLAHNADVNRDAHVHEMSSIAVCDNPRIVGSPLILSCRNGHLDVVKMLLEHKADVNQSNMFTWPLHAACTQKRMDVVKTLLSRRADVNYAISKSDMPMMLAAKHGNVYLAKLLVCHGAEIQFFGDDFNTPVTTAIHAGEDSSSANICDKIEVLKLLLTCKASANIGNMETRESPLIIAMNSEKMKDAVKILLDHKADVNADCLGVYPLPVAALRGDVDTVKLLLSHKAGLNKIVLKKAITNASEHPHKAVLEILEPLTTDTPETPDASNGNIKDIRKHIKRRLDAAQQKHVDIIRGKLSEGDTADEEIVKEVEEHIFLMAQHKLCRDNDERKSNGRKPMKWGKHLLHCMKELIDDGASDVVCTCKLRRKEN